MNSTRTVDGDCTSSGFPAGCCSFVSKSWYQLQRSYTFQVRWHPHCLCQDLLPWARLDFQGGQRLNVQTRLPYSSACMALDRNKSLGQAVKWPAAFRSSQANAVWPTIPYPRELERRRVSGCQPISRQAMFNSVPRRGPCLGVVFFSGCVWAHKIYSWKFIGLVFERTSDGWMLGLFCWQLAVWRSVAVVVLFIPRVAGWSSTGTSPIQDWCCREPGYIPRRCTHSHARSYLTASFAGQEKVHVCQYGSSYPSCGGMVANNPWWSPVQWTNRRSTASLIVKRSLLENYGEGCAGVNKPGMITAESGISKVTVLFWSLQICQLPKGTAAYSHFSQHRLQFVITVAGKQTFSCMQKGLRCSLLEHYHLSCRRPFLSLPFWYRTCSGFRCTAEPPLCWAWLHRYKGCSQPVRQMTGRVQDGKKVSSSAEGTKQIWVALATKRTWQR